MIPAYEAIKAINRLRGDAVVVGTMTPNRYWEAVSERPELDLPIFGAMGKASSVALGLALARPDRKVLVLDGDGALLMNLGTLVTIAGQRPRNLVHFVFDDVSSASTSGLPIKEMDNLDLAQIARSSGYAKTYEFDRLEEFLIGLEEVMRQTGPVFVRVKVFRDGDPLPFPERTMAQGWAEVKQQLTPPEDNAGEDGEEGPA